MRSVLVLLLALASCRMPPPSSGKLIHCGGQVIGESWPTLLPLVNDCLGREDLADQAAVNACLLALVKPAAGVTVDMIACMTHEQGGRFAESATANPADTRSARAAARARAFEQAQGFTYEGG